jgi:hypothetical protein
MIVILLTISATNIYKNEKWLVGRTSFANIIDYQPLCDVGYDNVIDIYVKKTLFFDRRVRKKSKIK